jgi:Bacterial Ig-like domain
MKKGISTFWVGFVGLGLLLAQQTALLSGCAQISAPTGGPKDSLAPKLMGANPQLKSVNVTGNKITLYFDEYVEVKDAFNNVLVSPLPKKAPTVDYKLKTVTVKLKDTLLPNTTYSINFGNAIVDINEGNTLNNFTYVFATGNKIDSLQIKGKVLLAETGKADSTLVAMLYRDAPDSAVEKSRPDYISRISGDGSFTFTNLPQGQFKVYALKDGDGSKSYNAKTESFAFLDVAIVLADSTPNLNLFAYSEQKDTRNAKPDVATPPTADKKLKYNTSLNNGLQDLLGNLVITFNRPLKAYNEGFVVLADTNYQPIAGTKFMADSSRKNITATTNWVPGNPYCLLINNQLGEDSLGVRLTKMDTLRFTAKKEEDYGKLVLRFSNMDTAKHMVLQFVQGDNVVKSQAINAKEWSDKLFVPGEYELRILYDTNKNGKWDPGSYSQKRQPERVVPLAQKLSIKANWDNERDINL